MKISELAQRAHTPVETVRYYEKAGLMPPPARTGSNYRRYDESHVARLRFIRHCRALDLSLEEIRALLRVRDDPQADCAAANELVRQHLAHVQQRMDELAQLAEQLQALERLCRQARPSAQCRILAELAQEPEGIGPSATAACLGDTHHRPTPGCGA
ncbi:MULTISPECIES: Cd(II)/Pb(II)-responsive transcriptional regulator [Caldimonas]|jgi:Cd(II)/Pb(II)-responsive transcriptional regulator|uniref:Cd(II)/Pb(II)-responsive transcriptional regulator n=1 Tax=Caldimonas TaxID=196013 RepID=UPI00037358FD|nr:MULTISPECIES: Cd(II)/Pb(II)-responsive transcriptional regulator [Caldimonas]GIX24296.1 MAG: transcriptional regulator [Caldimonas sp.]